MKKFPFFYIAAAIGFWLLTQQLGQVRPVEVSGPRFLAPPPDYIEYFAFGFRGSVADSLWLRWIQDNDVCQTYKGVEQPTAGLTLLEGFVNPRLKVCDNSWSFKMLDAVTRLDPKFKMPYEFGAITLAVLTEDYAGATIIFDRGLAAYPNDWDIVYRAAYHFLFDMSEADKAAGLFERLVKIGAPAWMQLLTARLYSRSGKLEVALATLKQYRESVKDVPDAVKHVDRRIADLEKQLSESKTKE